jgi:RNA polymerase sigma factor (sigma-70 family)
VCLNDRGQHGRVPSGRPIPLVRKQLTPTSVAVAHPDELSVGITGAEGIEAVFAALEAPLLGYAMRMVGCRETAEDLVQDAFIKLHVQTEPIHHPRRWLYNTLHNLALNHLRKAGKLISVEEITARSMGEWPDPQPLPDEQIAHCEAIGLVRLGLESLDARKRELIDLKFREGLSYKEIGARTGLKEGHVGYLIHHGLRALSDEVKRTGGDR